VENELDHIRRRLTVEGEKTLTFFKSLSTVDWDQRVYTTGSQWHVRQVLAHFISAERAYQKYLREVLDGGPGAPEDMDIDAFNEAEAPKLSKHTSEDLIAMMQVARQDTLRLAENLTEEDLRIQARHPWFGEKEISWYLKLLYRHNTMHLQDVRKALEMGKAVPHR
jgi:uncharacterized damage-inducible protein DinB